MTDFNKLSFRNKLRSAFLALTILSILVTGGFSYYITSTIIENNALKLTQDTVVQSAQIVDEKLGKLMLVMMTFMISEPFQNLMDDVSAGEDRRYFTHLSNLDNAFSQARIAEPLIHSIYISTPIGEFYPLAINRNRQTVFNETPLFERFNREKRNVWVEGHEDMLFSGKNRVISLVLEPIIDNTINVKDVYVVVNIREDGIRKLLGTETVGGSSRFLLNADAALVGLERNPLVMEAVNSGLMGEIIKNEPMGYTSYELGNDSHLLNYARLGINDWTVMAIQSKDHVLRDMIYVKWMILFITVCCFVVTVFVSGAFTRYLLKPLQGLQQVMKRVENNDLSARFKSKNEDELAQVGFRFNRMLSQIVLLIEEVKKAEANKRAAEIKALSAQMDPHFLYNALNTIYWKLKLKQVDQSQQMVVSLSRLFQLGLNKGNEITTLDKELQHVRQYLELQTYCYENLFEYDIQVREPSLMELPVPRIMLQPLVENSIQHGFQNMESGGRITIDIDVNFELGHWTMRVQDNGCGMEEATIHSLRQQDPERGYAIGNLISRLQLYYGDHAELYIQSPSPSGKGTIALITIPLKGMNPDVQA
ncbi:sensor histidine kinase [Cohnella luojiensis]|uniref:Sensor histidine kinase n=1 Tax=Cohnella luojiensis TaxID=652876 RepID=A0A4Y8MAW8_9BACL|nr:sensor histidine kinase [Cohnella luojiensis]TFE31517.1 sensor histidine kinase [Cohnella luojiensis]